MSVRRNRNRAAVCSGRGFLDNLVEIGSNVDVGSLLNTGKKILGPLLQEISFLQPPPRPGRGRGGVYKNQGSGRFKKGSEEAKKYMAKLRSMRGKGVKAVTDFSQLSKDEMLDFMKMTASMQAHLQNRQKNNDSDDEDDD